MSDPRPRCFVTCITDPDGHTGFALPGSDLERRCIAREAEGYLDALCLGPNECPSCVALAAQQERGWESAWPTRFVALGMLLCLFGGGCIPVPVVETGDWPIASCNVTSRPQEMKTNDRGRDYIEVSTLEVACVGDGWTAVATPDVAHTMTCQRRERPTYCLPKIWFFVCKARECSVQVGTKRLLIEAGRNPLRTDVIGVNEPLTILNVQ